MSTRLLYSHIIKNINYKKYFKPIIFEENKLNLVNPLCKQLTLNKIKNYNNMIKYDLSEYYMYTVNNINIFKISLDIKDLQSNNNYIEELHFGSYKEHGFDVDKKKLLSSNIILNKESINYNDIDINFVNKIKYIGFIEKLHSDINYYNMIKNFNLLHSNIILNKNIVYKKNFYKICNELNKIEDNKINELVNDLILLETTMDDNMEIYFNSSNDTIIKTATNIMNNYENNIIKIQIDILIKILQFNKTQHYSFIPVICCV